MKRIWSRKTYNGYHLVSLSGDPSPIGLFKKDGGKDEYGFTADIDKRPRCPHPEVSTMCRPWGEFIIVPSKCQRCIWLYQTPDNEYDCLFCTKAKINPSALVTGGE